MNLQFKPEVNEENGKIKVGTVIHPINDGSSYMIVIQYKNSSLALLRLGTLQVLEPEDVVIPDDCEWLSRKEVDMLIRSAVGINVNNFSFSNYDDQLEIMQFECR